MVQPDLKVIKRLSCKIQLLFVFKKSYINYTFFNQTIYLITTSLFNLILLLLFFFIYLTPRINLHLAS